MDADPGVTTRIFQEGDAWAYEIERPVPLPAPTGKSWRSIATGTCSTKERAERAVAMVFELSAPIGIRRVEGIYDDAGCQEALRQARREASIV